MTISRTREAVYVRAQLISNALDDSSQAIRTSSGQGVSASTAHLQALKAFQLPTTCEDAVRSLQRTTLAHLSATDVETIVEELLSQELLYSLPTTADGEAKDTSTSDTQHPVIAVPTDGRIEESIRLADSVAVSTADLGHVAPYPDVHFYCGRSTKDDFRDRVKAGSRADLEGFRTTDDRTQFARELAQATGIDPAITTFALVGPAELARDRGAPRNTALLRAGGRPVFMFGDDLSLTGLVRQPDCVRFRSKRFGTPVSLEHAASREELLHRYPVQPIRWEEVLRYAPGQSVQSLAGTCEDFRYDYSDCDADLAHRVFRRSGQVDLTCFGTIGDSAMTQVQGTLFRPPFAITDPAADPQVYRVTRESREVLRMPDGLAVTDHPFFVSAACAFDTSRLLPPFFPASRGTDTVFGAMLTGLFPDALIAHAPIAFFHNPPHAGHDKRMFRYDVHMTAALIISLMIRKIDIPDHIVDRAERLRFAGQWVGSVTRVSIKAFTGWVEELLIEFFSERHWQLQQLLGAYNGEPAEWADDVRRLASTLRERIEQRSILPIMDYGSGALDTDATTGLFQEHLQMYGKLLVAWPDMVQAASGMAQ